MRVIFGLVLLLGLGSANAMAAATIASHKATYQISLARSSPAGAIQGLSGEMTLQVSELCEGFAVNQYLETNFWAQDGVLQLGQLTASSWETRDGQQMRFTLANKIDGQLSEAFEGQASKPKGEVLGQILYKDNSYDTATLPGDAIFPREHLVFLLEAAEKKQRTLVATVFDGAEDGKVYATTAIIGGQKEPPQGGHPGVHESLANLPYWPVVLSYFPTDSTDPLPDYETSFHLFENGVSTNLVMDYGDFAMKGRLDALEQLSDGNCGL